MNRRTAARLGLVALATCIVTIGMVGGVGALALTIDWRLPPPQDVGHPSMLVDRDGTPIYRFAAEVERTPVPRSHMADSLAQAVVAAEDHRFYEHQGVDPFSVVRAVVRNVAAGSIREGGSTLTQQYVKNAFTGADRTFARKAREAVLALQLEKELSKDEILESYLNRAYFGDGAYGAQAAARSYFDVDAADLSLGQSALLAGLLSAPSDLSPRHHLGRAMARRDLVLQRMDELGMISARERHEARQAPIEVVGEDADDHAAPYYVERVRRQLLADPDVGHERLYYGGLRITAALDVDRQLALRRAVTDHLPDDPGLDAGVAVVEPGTGDVVAAYSGRDFEDSRVDLALRPSSGRPSGSTFKTFALVAALEDQWTLDSGYPAPQQVTIGDWSPSGSGDCPSPCSLLEATVHSSNTVFAQLANDVGGEPMTDMARRLGSRHRFDDPEQITHVLGPGAVTPLDMASAFATLANDGVACPARLVTEIRADDGTTIAPPDPRQPSDAERQRWAQRLTDLGYELDEADDAHGRCYRAVAPSVARASVHALEQAVERGTGTRAALDDHPVAGKTGTAQDSTMVWFTGTTPQLAISASFGGREQLTPLRGLPGCGRSCYGGQLTARMWHDAAESLHADLEPGDFGPLLPDERQRVADRDQPDDSPQPDPTPTAPGEPAGASETPASAPDDATVPTEPEAAESDRASAEPDPQPVDPDPEPAEPDPEPVEPDAGETDAEPAEPDPEQGDPDPEPVEPDPQPGEAEASTADPDGGGSSSDDPPADDEDTGGDGAIPELPGD